MNGNWRSPSDFKVLPVKAAITWGNRETPYEWHCRRIFPGSRCLCHTPSLSQFPAWIVHHGVVLAVAFDPARLDAAGAVGDPVHRLLSDLMLAAEDVLGQFDDVRGEVGKCFWTNLPTDLVNRLVQMTHDVKPIQDEEGTLAIGASTERTAQKGHDTKRSDWRDPTRRKLVR